MRFLTFFQELGILGLLWPECSFRLRSFFWGLLRVFTCCADGGVYTRTESGPLEGRDYGNLGPLVDFSRIGINAQSAVGEFHCFRFLGASCEPP